MANEKKYEAATPHVSKKEKEVEEVASINPERKSRKGLIFVLTTLIALPLLGMGALFGYQMLYQDKVYEGVRIISRNDQNQITMTRNLGGMTKKRVVQMVDEINKKYQRQGIILRVTDTSGTVHTIPFTSSKEIEGNQLEIARIDGNKLADYVFAFGRGGNQFLNFREMIVLLFQKQAGITTNSLITFNSEIFNDSVRELIGPYENPAQNAQITIASLSPLDYQVVPEKNGTNFNYKMLENTFRKRLQEFSFEPIPVSPEPTSPSVTASEASSAAARIPTILAESLNLVYEEATSSISQKWKLSPEQLSKWLVPIRSSNNEVSFGVDEKLVTDYLEANISKYINRQPREAIFKREGEKVTEFKGSVVGQSVDYTVTAQRITEALLLRQTGQTATSSLLAVKIVEPEVTVAEANDLGITGVIGVGYSTFKGSSASRIKNLTRAVTILNGVLIKPGEKFSTLNNLAPFTANNGYVPELVIKGKEIKPEMGGGLCQISTTLFRTAMNSAMPITERTAHGLVVSYYADARNGNPGTDATIYEPTLDLKFENDTGHYMLLQTEIDYANQKLTFTLWGKPDGRKGSYSAPIVLSRSGAGAAQEIPDPTMTPGTRRCQGAFGGAVTSFTYTRILPSGEQIDRVFQSTYRPQPAICYVGVEKGSEPMPNDNLIVDAPIVDELAPVN